MIRFDKFGGLVPRLNPEQLPDNGAQIAHNVDVSSGVLAPLNIPGSFIRLHDLATNKLTGTVPEGDVVSITKPDAPTVFQMNRQCVPITWFRIWAHDWVSWINDTGERQTIHLRSQIMQVLDITYTETGLQITTFLNPQTYFFQRGGPYFLKGPRYQFEFLAMPGVLGGPDTRAIHPGIASEFDQVIPSQQVPLVDTNDNIYGFWEVIDVYGPKYDEELLITDFDLVWYRLPSIYNGHVTFFVNLNYVVSKRRHVFYAQSAVNAQDQEGPPSEISERITLKPGDVVTLNTPRPSGFSKNKLYRSVTGGDDFLLIDDINADQHIDLSPQLKVETIQPFGNLPAGVAATDFLEGSFIHPAQFGVAIHGDTLYLSDPYNFHSWPDENTTPFVETIKAHNLTGNTIVLFSGNSVFGVSGSNPAKMSKFVISNTTPLLNKLGLCRIGQTIYFPSDDGLIAITGSEVKNVTASHFTRQQWQFLTPESMKASTADGSIFLEATIETGAANPADPFVISMSRLSAPGADNPITENARVNIRIDLDEDISAVTSYVQVTNSSFEWLSKRVYSDQEIIIDYAKVTADAYPVTIELFADRVSLGEITVNSDQPFPIPGAVHAHEWEVKVTSSNIVRLIDLFERVVLPIQDSVTLTPESVDVWQNIRLKFPDFDKFAAGILSAQTDATIPVTFYADDVEAAALLVQGGRVFTFPRNMVPGTHWRVVVDTDKHIDELVLIRRTTQSVDGVLREVNGGGVAPWLVKRYEFVDSDDIRSIVVKARQNVTMNLYYDGAETATQTITVESGQEIRVSNGLMTSLEFDFDGFDWAVQEVLVYTVGAARPVSVDSGIQLNGERSYRRMLFEFPDRGVFACGSLGAKSYGDDGITLKLYTDGVLVHTETITNGNVFKLPRSLAEGKLWEIDIDTPEEVYSFNLFPRRPAQAKDGLIRILNPERIPPWCVTRYEFPEDTRLMSAIVNAESAVTLRLYADGAEAPTETIVLSPGVETLLDDMVALRAVEFDFTEDEKVQEISIFGRVTQPVGTDGVSEDGRLNWRDLRYKFAEKSTFALAVLDVDDYTDVTLILSADGIEQYHNTIVGGNPFALPREMALGLVWDVDVITSAKVESLDILTRQVQSVQSGVIRAVNNSGIASWRFTRYEFPDRKRIQSVIVHADESAYPLTMRIFKDNGPNPSKTVEITSAAEQRLAIEDLHEAVEFDFDGSDHLVRDVTLFAHDDQIVGENGISLQNAPSYRGLRFKFEGGAGAFVSGTIGASAYDGVLNDVLKLRLYADGILKETVSVTDGKPFKLDRSNGEAEVWEVDVEHTGEVSSLFLYARAQVPAGDTIRELSSDGIRTAPWLRKRYEFQDSAELRSLVVKASSYPVRLRGYIDGATSSSFSQSIQDAREVPFSNGPKTVDHFEFDFDHDDRVTEVMIFPDSTVPVEGTGFVFRGNGRFQPWRNKTLRFSDTGSWSVGRVVATDYSGMLLKLMIDGTTYATQSISDSNEFKFPLNLRAGRDWQLDIRHQGRIQEVILIQRQPIEIANGRVFFRKQDDPFTWLQKQVISRTPVSFSCARIVSDKYPVTLKVYHLSELMATIAVADERAFRLPALRPEREWSFDITASSSSALVKEAVIATSMDRL